MRDIFDAESLRGSTILLLYSITVDFVERCAGLSLLLIWGTEEFLRFLFLFVLPPFLNIFFISRSTTSPRLPRLASKLCFLSYSAAMIRL